MDDHRDQATRDKIEVLRDLEKIPLLKHPYTAFAISSARIGLEALQGESSKADLLMDASQLGIGLTKGMVGQGMKMMKAASENPPQLTSSSASNQNRFGYGQVPTSSNSNRPVVMQQKATGTHGGGSSQRAGHAESSMTGVERTGPGFTSPDLNIGRGSKKSHIAQDGGRTSADALGLESGNTQSLYWKKFVEFAHKEQKNKVYQRDDLIDLKKVDARGRSNIGLNDRNGANANYKL